MERRCDGGRSRGGGVEHEGGVAVSRGGARVKNFKPYTTQIFFYAKQKGDKVIMSCVYVYLTAAALVIQHLHVLTSSNYREYNQHPILLVLFSILL